MRKTHAHYCSSGILFLDRIWRWLPARTSARVLAGAAARRDDRYSLRGAFPSYCNRTGCSLAPENVGLESEPRVARGNGYRGAPFSAVGRLRCRSRSSWKYRVSAVRPPRHAGWFDLCGFAYRVRCSAVLANWPQRPEARPMHTALRAVKVIHTLVWALFVSCMNRPGFVGGSNF